MSFTSVTEPQPSLAWQFENSNVDYVSSLSPSYSTVSGALTSLPTFVSGKYNQAIRLAQTAANAGANTYVLWSLAASPISIDTTGITIACWVNWTTLPGSFISIYDSFSNVLGIYMNSTQTYTGRGFSGTQALTNATSNTSTNSTGVWYHIALTYNSTSVILYKNGVGTTPVATGAPGVTVTGLRIGSQANNINPTYVGYACADCTIDDLRVYNVALTSTQVQSVYSSQGAPAPGPVMPQPQYAWDFNGTTTPYIGSATGTTTGSVSYNSAGKYGQSLVIKNPTTGPTSANNINWITNSTFNMDAGFSVCFWLKVSTIPATDQSVIFFTNNSIIDYRYYISVGPSSTISFVFYNNSTFIVPTSYTLSTNTWLHVVAQTVGGSMQFYINGTLFSSSAYAPSGCTLNAGLWLGGIGNYGPTNAEYDDLRIYNTALTSIQVNDIYNQQGVPGRGVVVSNKRAPGSTAIYSTNWVNPSYSGAIVNVERASDGTTSDFYVDKSGNFTQSSGTSLASWLGGAQANVLIWYDQSGAGLNAIKDNTTVYGRAPQLVVDPAGSGKYVIYFPNQNSSNVSYYGFRISPQTTSSMMCRFYMPTGKIGDSNWESILCTNIDNQGVRFRPLTMTTGDGNDFLNPGGFAIHDGTLNTTSPYLTTTKGSWHTMMASRASGTLSMEYIGQCNNAWNNGSIIPRSFYGYMTDMVTFTTPSGPSAYSDYFASPTTTLSSAPLFNQLSPAATSSAVGAFSLRAVNGVTTRAVAVRAQGQFPPAAMTSDGPQTLTGYSFGGSGSYVASASLDDVYIDYGFRAFDNNIGTWWHSNYPIYTSDTGIYNSGDARASITGGIYAGEWLQIKMTTPILLISYSLVGRPGFETNRSPRKFWILGSNNDGANWSLVDTQTSINTWASPQVFKTFTISNPGTTYFNTFRIVVNEVGNLTTGASGQDSVQIASWNLVGSPPSADFYADERGNLLTAPVVGTTLQNWLGGATGYVTTWYDQSGRGNHMSCSSAGIQPKIDTANAWLDFKTSAYFDTSANPASGPVPYSNTMNYTVICRHNTIGNNAGGICGSAQTNNNNYTNNFRRAGAAYQSYWYSNDQTAGTYATGNKVTFKWDGTNRYIYGNGTLQATTASNNWWQTSSSAQLIGKTTNDTTMNGEMYSIFMFNTALSDSDRILGENFS